MADGWRVVSQRGTERLTAAGKFEQGVEVSVETVNGTPNTFFIPQAKYTADYVQATVDEWAERERAVHNL